MDGRPEFYFRLHHRGISTVTPSVQPVEFEKMLSDFISTAGHELRTPLTSILGFSELLLHQQEAEGGLLDSHRQYLGYIVKNANKLKGIVDKLLDLDCLRSGQRIGLNKLSCNIESIVKEAVLPFHKEPGKLFWILLSDGKTVLSVDRGKMQQALEELIRNAFKFSPGSPVYLRGYLAGENYQLFVEDEGGGMTSEQVERVFDPFYRVDSSNTAPEGFGVGLSWAKGIVESHGGTIRIESEQGLGTRVSISLPMDFKNPSRECAAS
jgi:signal transduction histidine kinase